MLYNTLTITVSKTIISNYNYIKNNLKNLLFSGFPIRRIYDALRYLQANKVITILCVRRSKYVYIMVAWSVSLVGLEEYTMLFNDRCIGRYVSLSVRSMNGRLWHIRHLES